jgi:phage host-nuclease inhibitor protein Gam
VTAESPKDSRARALVARRLRRLASLQSQLDACRAEMAQEAALVSRRYTEREAALQARVEEQLADLERRCRHGRDSLFPPGRKTLSTPFGEVAFRKADPSVATVEGVAEDDACRLLRQAGLAAFVRVLEKVDRAAVRSALRRESVTPAELGRCGLVLLEGPERFYCKVWQHGLVEAGGRSA